MKLGRVVKAVAFSAAALVLIALVAFAWLKLAPRRVPDGQAPLVTLREGSLPAFRASFNAGAGDEVRLLAMLSPT